MKNRFFGMGVLVLALAFGMMAAGCDDGNGNGGGVNYLDTMGLSTADPNAAALLIGDITLAQFNQVKGLLSGFQGWSTFDGDLNLIWTGRTQSQVDIAISTLEGFAWSSSKSWGYDFDPSEQSVGGYYIPAGTLWIYFY